MSRFQCNGNNGNGSPGDTIGEQQLATYTADAKGNLTTNNTWKNMPTVNVGGSDVDEDVTLRKAPCGQRWSGTAGLSLQPQRADYFLCHFGADREFLETCVGTTTIICLRPAAMESCTCSRLRRPAVSKHQDRHIRFQALRISFVQPLPVE